jgi:hypothetical protein
MVGCGGFGAAIAAVAIMVKAAAKEPAIVAAVMILEFIDGPFQEIDVRCAGKFGDGRLHSKHQRAASSNLPAAASQSCDAIRRPNKIAACSLDEERDPDEEIPAYFTFIAFVASQSFPGGD